MNDRNSVGWLNPGLSLPFALAGMTCGMWSDVMPWYWTAFMGLCLYVTCIVATTKPVRFMELSTSDGPDLEFHLDPQVAQQLQEAMRKDV